MPRTSSKEQAKNWHSRLKAADKVYEDWERDWKVRQLEQWYLGKQWQDDTDSQREKYVINLIFASMETKKPSLLFFRPQAVLTPRPSRSDDPGSPIEQRAKLLEDTVNTYAADPRVKLRQQTLLALHESFFRFGVVEVGYTADFIDNPRAGKPMLKEDAETKAAGTEMPMLDESGQPVMEPDQILNDEQLYVRRIPASQFRFPECGNNTLEWNDWYAYFEWVNLEDVKRNPNYKNAAKLKASGKLKSDSDYTTEDESKKGKIKLWKIYDLRAKTRYVLPDNHDQFIQEKPLPFIPHALLKFIDILDSALPLPPIYNWLHPQREYNETREDMRAFRRGAYRRYTYRDGSIDESEIQKLENGGDGVYAKTNQDAPIAEVPQGKLNQGVVASVPITKDDFNNITAVSAEQRNSAEAETATQAQIKQMNSSIRESFSRFQVAEWLSEVFRIMLKTIREYFTLPMVIQTNVDPTALGMEQEVVRIAQDWLMVTAPQLGSMEYEVAVDVESLSPASQESKKREFMDVLQNVFGNPGASMILMLSPSLLKRLLESLNIRSDAILTEVQQALQAMQLMTQLQNAGPKPPGQGGKPEPGPTPDQGGIRQQLQQQMGAPIQ